MEKARVNRWRSRKASRSSARWNRSSAAASMARSRASPATKPPPRSRSRSKSRAASRRKTTHRHRRGNGAQSQPMEESEFPKAVESIWAPWRVEYYRIEKTPDFLVEAAQAPDDAAHLVVARRKSTFLIMNRFPYAVGHLMAVPYRKVADIADLTEQERLELWELAAHAQAILKKTVRAQGIQHRPEPRPMRRRRLRRPPPPAHRPPLGGRQ